MAALAATLGLTLLGGPGASAAPAADAKTAPATVTQDPVGTKPTVVLVHGAFADASGWTGVVQSLQRLGYTVIAPPGPPARGRLGRRLRRQRSRHHLRTDRDDRALLRR